MHEFHTRTRMVPYKSHLDLDSKLPMEQFPECRGLELCRVVVVGLGTERHSATLKYPQTVGGAW